MMKNNETPKPPTQDELKAYVAQISFLGQIRSLLQEINDEHERSTSLLREQEEVLSENSDLVLNLSSNIWECEEGFKRLTKQFNEGKCILESKKDADAPSEEADHAAASHGETLNQPKGNIE